MSPCAGNPAAGRVEFQLTPHVRDRLGGAETSPRASCRRPWNFVTCVRVRTASSPWLVPRVVPKSRFEKWIESINATGRELSRFCSQAAVRNFASKRWPLCAINTASPTKSENAARASATGGAPATSRLDIPVSPVMKLGMVASGRTKVANTSSVTTPPGPRRAAAI